MIGLRGADTVLLVIAEGGIGQRDVQRHKCRCDAARTVCQRYFNAYHLVFGNGAGNHPRQHIGVFAFRLLHIVQQPAQGNVAERSIGTSDGIERLPHVEHRHKSVCPSIEGEHIGGQFLWRGVVFMHDHLLRGIETVEVRVLELWVRHPVGIETHYGSSLCLSGSCGRNDVRIIPVARDKQQGQCSNH